MNHHKRNNHNGILVYLAGPIHGSGSPETNLDIALRAAEMLYDAGFTPFVPNLFGQWERRYPLEGLEGQEKWMAMDFEWLSRCDVLVRIPGRSPGADREVELAQELGIPVFANDDVPGIDIFSPVDRVIGALRAGRFSHLGPVSQGRVRGAEMRTQFGTPFLPHLQGITLATVQEAVVEWLMRQPFAKQEGWEPLLGIQEEVGELSHAFLKKHQHIRGSDGSHDEEMKDAVGDILIFLSGFCHANGMKLERAFSDAWARVATRDWNRFPGDGVSK